MYNENGYLIHSAKGTTWGNHKYIAIKNGRYIYPTENSAKTLNGYDGPVKATTDTAHGRAISKAASSYRINGANGMPTNVQRGQYADAHSTHYGGASNKGYNGGSPNYAGINLDVRDRVRDKGNRNGMPSSVRKTQANIINEGVSNTDKANSAYKSSTDTSKITPNSMHRNQVNAVGNISKTISKNGMPSNIAEGLADETKKNREGRPGITVDRKALDRLDRGEDRKKIARSYRFNRSTAINKPEYGVSSKSQISPRTMMEISNHNSMKNANLKRKADNVSMNNKGNLLENKIPGAPTSTFQTNSQKYPIGRKDVVGAKKGMNSNLSTADMSYEEFKEWSKKNKDKMEKYNKSFKGKADKYVYQAMHWLNKFFK